jgi:2',3'-cyclic-nucleotide 2'-phosphodiesterase (5'-nucleotidase family)
MLNKTIYLLVIFITSGSPSAQPYEKNLRIMSFSNSYGVDNSALYLSSKKLLSNKGEDIYPIIGSEAVNESFGIDYLIKEKTGGIKGLMQLVEKTRREVGHKNHLLIDAGGSLYKVINNSKKSDVALMSAHIDMGVNIMTLGAELQGESSWVESIARQYGGSNIEVLSTNIRDNEGFLFNPYSELSFNEKKIVIFGISNFRINMNSEDTTNDPEIENLRSMIEAYVPVTDMVILVSSNSITDNLFLANEIDGINLIIGGSDSLILPHPIKAESGTTIITTGYNGRFLSILDIDLSKRKLDRFRYELRPVIPSRIENELFDHRSYYKQTSKTKSVGPKVSRNISTGWSQVGELDVLIMNTLKENIDADVLLGVPSGQDIVVPKGSQLTEDIINRYFNNKNHRYVEVYMEGLDIKDLIEKFYKRDLSIYNYKALRSSGIDYEVIFNKDKSPEVIISKINSTPYKKTKKYKVIGWGDIDAEDTSRRLIEDVFKGHYENSKFKIKKYKDKIIFTTID